jgi:hypothetical protein
MAGNTIKMMNFGALFTVSHHDKCYTLVPEDDASGLNMVHSIEHCVDVLGSTLPKTRCGIFEEIRIIAGERNRYSSVSCSLHDEYTHQRYYFRDARCILLFTRLIARGSEAASSQKEQKKDTVFSVHASHHDSKATKHYCKFPFSRFG